MRLVREVVAALLVAAAFAAAAPGVGVAGAPPYPPDVGPPLQIIPGVRIGPYSLTTGLAGLRRLLGSPAAASPRPMFDQRPGMTGYVWRLPAGTLTAWSANGRTIGYLELRDNRTYRTVKGIGVGSNSMDVQAAYGAPTARTAIPGASRYVYNALGLAVFTQGTSTGFMIVGVDVFRPGTAGNFWKF
ncbi:MAG TPA: hypothetical protein VGK88_08570 [bacterium]|jgi:hypothetical protein